MGKIQADPNYIDPEEQIEGDEDLPGLEPSENEDDVVIANEGTPVVPTEGEEDEDEGGKGEPEKPFLTFKDQAEYDAYIKAHPPVVTPEKPTPPAPPKPETPTEEEDEFDKIELFKGSVDPETGKWVGEVPKDWNDFARRIMKQMSPKVYAPKIVEQIKNMTAKEKAEFDSINQEFDQEFDAMATEGLVPKRGTKEGDEVNAQISTIGGQYGQTSMRKAYELWKKIPKTEGGGLDYKPEPEKKKVNPSKQVSRLIGSPKATQTAGKSKSKVIPYAKLHGARSVDDLLDDDE